MKNLKIILFISSLIIGMSFSAEDEEEVRTIEKDGVLYKINNTSLHITPYTEEEQDNAISKESDAMDGASKIVQADSKESTEITKKQCCQCDLTISMGTVMALGDDANVYDPGTSLGIFVPTPWAFDLFGKNWKVSAELNISNLKTIGGGDDLNINGGIAHFTPSFELPIDIDFGLGIAHSKGLSGISGTIVLDIAYKLPFEKADFSLGFRYQKLIDVLKEDPFLDFGLLDIYGFNLTFSKGLGL